MANRKIDNPLFVKTEPETSKNMPLRDENGKFISREKARQIALEELKEDRARIMTENRLQVAVAEIEEEDPSVAVSTLDENMEVAMGDATLTDIEAMLAESVPTDDVIGIHDKGGSVLSVIEEMETELGEVNSVNHSLNEELGATRKEVTKLRAARENLHARLEEASTEIEDMKHIREEFQKLQSDLHKVEDKFLASQKEIEFLQSEKRNLEFELHGAKSQVRELERVNAENSDEIRGLREKVTLLEDIQANLDLALQKKNRELERIPALEAELEAVTTTRDALDLDLRTAKKVLVRMREDMEVLETQYVQTVEERDSLAKKLASSEAENIEAANRVQALAREVGQVRSEKRQQDNELVVLKKWVNQIHTKLITTRSRTKHTEVEVVE